MLKPQASSTREILDLDGLWLFATDSDEVTSPWSGPLATTLEAPVPASYNDLFIDPMIRDHVGWVWYQRTVRVPRGWSSGRVIVRVDAATHHGRVYVGDRLVAEHVGGYTPFEADVTDLVDAGQEFRLTIGVDNELTNTTIPPGRVVIDALGRRKQTYLHDFFNYAGLARSVRLVSIPEVHLDDITVVTDQDQGIGSVTYAATTSVPADVRVRLLDSSGETVGTATGASGRIEVPAAHLWRPGAAYLYQLHVEALDGGGVIDEYRLPVGIRSVRIDGRRFLLNGEPFYFTGFGKHEDSPVRGKGHDDAYLVHDFQLMEWTGANSFRTAHYPYAEEVLELADRHGFVVIDETAAVGLNLAMGGGIFGGIKQQTFSADTVNDETREAHAQAIRELVARDKNHPSVVMWSIANEPASGEPGAREYFAPLVDLTRSLDPSRPVTFANMAFTGFGADRIADLFDVICLNRYFGWYVDIGDLSAAEQHLEAELLGWQARFEKPLVVTEYGADALAGTHSVFDQPWSEEYQRDVLEMCHRVHDRIEAVVGEQVWNFADFQTSVGIARVDGNKKGVFTRDRRPKAAAHALRARWTTR